MDYAQMTDEELLVEMNRVADEAQKNRETARAIRAVLNERSGAAKAKATVASLSDAEKAALRKELAAEVSDAPKGGTQ